jgi:DNA-binding PadR family transcriptional regulator
MAGMTDAELAILSLLAEGPSFDHDLNATIEARGLRRWTAIGSSSMYYVLDKLEKQGLVQIVSETDGRREFKISPAGVGVLQTAVSDLLSTPHAHDKSIELRSGEPARSQAEPDPRRAAQPPAGHSDPDCAAAREPGRRTRTGRCLPDPGAVCAPHPYAGGRTGLAR